MGLTQEYGALLKSENKAESKVSTGLKQKKEYGAEARVKSTGLKQECEYGAEARV